MVSGFTRPVDPQSALRLTQAMPHVDASTPPVRHRWRTVIVGVMSALMIAAKKGKAGDVALGVSDLQPNVNEIFEITKVESSSPVITLSGKLISKRSDFGSTKTLMIIVSVK